MKQTVLFLVAVIALGLPIQTRAQSMPSPAELKLPAGAQPVAVTTTLTTTKEIAPGENTATGMPGDPCPNLKGATENAPDDLSKVQQDIDRFTLCVQRAQLLERLNESAIKASMTTDAALGLGGMPLGIGGMGGPLPTNMPPLPANALGGADVTPAGTPAAITPGVTASGEAEQIAPEPQWQIREIFGSSGDMQARLLSPLGDEMKVKKGSRLPDSSVVMSITPEGVSIRGKNGVKSLAWAGS